MLINNYKWISQSIAYNLSANLKIPKIFAKIPNDKLCLKLIKK